MARRSTPYRKVADDAFPIRVKIKVPPLGFGQRYDVYNAWLRELPDDQYAWHPAGLDTAFYFRSLALAQRFLAAFPELELADRVETTTY